MPLAPGSRLGVYEILSPLGAGGMGEVYRARDARLERDVAIKVLPSHLANDAGAVARFAREAKAVAALSHPNILAIFDVGTEGDVAFAAMELLEGETLRQRLGSGALPWKKAAQIGAQVAQGLAAAHDKGIVHRDLKPENIFILADGHVKILDFGLARQIVASAEAANAMTEKIGTEPGVVLGTVGYMSPEQVKGRAADARSDIFSLGCVLFECVTGTRAFARDTAAETMSAILRDELPEDAITQRSLPAAFQQVLRHCLEKRPEERFQSARDLAFALQALPASSATSGPEPIAAARRARRPRGAAIAAGILIAVASMAIGWLWRGSPAGQAPPAATVSSLLAPPDAEFAFHHGFALSPDGSSVVFAARTAADGSQLWLRSLADDRAKPLTGTVNGVYPIWSPDSQHVAFFREDTRQLMRVAIAGGPAQLICAVPDTREPRMSWGRHGEILVGVDIAGEGAGPRLLLRVPASGGTPEPVTGFDKGNVIEPSWLDDDRFVYRDQVRGNASRVLVGSARGAHAPIEIEGLKGIAFFRVVTDARTVLFRRARVLYAQAIDLASGQLVGEPKALSRTPGSPLEWFALSATSDSLVMLAPEVTDNGNPGDPLSQLQWLDRRGQVVGTLGGGPRRYWGLRLSPDGTRAAVNPDEDVWVYRPPATRTRITTEDPVDFAPVWSPDGKQLIFRRNLRTWLVSSSEATTPTEIPEIFAVGAARVTDWSTDGRFLLLSTGRSGNNDLQLFDRETKKVSPVAATTFDEYFGRFSPNGRWVAYTTNSTGRIEVFVRRIDASAPPVQVSTDGGLQPFWRHDGKEVFFLTQSSQIVAADASQLETRGAIGALETLFRLPLNDISPYGSIDIAPDGRFLANVLMAPEPLTLIRNWQSLIKK